MQQDKEIFRTFSRRAAILAGTKAVLIGALTARMYYLQVLESDRYALLAEENRINLRLLPPPRGRILDRFGAPLASNDQNYRAVVVAEQTDDLEATLGTLGRLLPIDAATHERIRKEIGKKRAFVPITVQENLDWPVVARIEVNAPDLPGISIEAEQSRLYPYGGAAAHVLGYVGAVSEPELTGDPLLELPGFRIGKSGVEKQYDLALRGSAGNSQVEVNAVGRVIRELTRNDGTPGQDLYTSLDMPLQSFVQQRLAVELSGSAVVLDVMTGELLAMGSTPTFDPLVFDRGVTSAEWQSLIGDKLRPLSNKALIGQYAPGSTFKMVVALAALKAGVPAGHSVYCPGFISLGNARFHCWKKDGHGTLDMVGGLRHSCDVYFYDIARRAGIDAIAEMARLFGFGRPVGLDLPGERAGVIPDRAWKEANLGEIWQVGETLVAGIGQGFIQTTPLQLAVMCARLANGGYAIRPTIRRESEFVGLPAKLSGSQGAGLVEVPPFPSLGLPPEHLGVVIEGMNQVTNDQRGTGYRVRIEEPGMEMAGKTGTSQVRRITMAERLTGVSKNEDLPWERRDHALFVGFAPVQAPRYAVAVIIEHGGGGSKVAGPILRDILLEAQIRDPARRRPDGRVAAMMPT